MVSAAALKPYLNRCGYGDSLLREQFLFADEAGEQRVDLVGFAHVPFDARTACVAVIETQGEPEVAVGRCRDLGAPVIFVCKGDTVQWWKQGSTPTMVDEAPADAVARLFEGHHDQLQPESVYRAKTRGRLEHQYQRKFVDIGLMSLVEAEIGHRVSDLIERIVVGLEGEMGAEQAPDQVRHWFLTSAFWMVAAKILRDKLVPAFQDIDLLDIDAVFGTVCKHYRAAVPMFMGRPDYRRALKRAAPEVARFSNLSQVTTESLAYVYENTLISKATRKRLGTHSTPSYLVDYIVGRLAPWIEEIPIDEREIFEPACGHAAFLVSAMRLLRDLLPSDHPLRTSSEDLHEYLRGHLCGIEIDEAAREIARLSLTLADVPNPNGWRLENTNMFTGDLLERMAGQSSILLANPPFEKFSPVERETWGIQPQHFNKTAELLARTLPHLRQNAVFGVVVPQNLLHEADAASLRSRLLREFEFEEIILFPDKVFSFADCESAVLIGRRHTIGTQPRAFHYRRIREPDIEQFKQTYETTTDQEVDSRQFDDPPNYSLRKSDLSEIWTRPEYGALKDLALVGQGLMHKGKGRDLPKGALTESLNPFPGAAPGYSKVPSNLLLHGHPPEVWLSLERAHIRRPMSGAETGTPQVLLNYAPVSRGPWRLKAFIDREGHAVTSRFLVVRPLAKDMPLEFIWALCNSPIANAYVYDHSSKRDITAGLMRELPVPRVQSDDWQEVAEAAAKYLSAASAPPLERPKHAALRRLLLSVDAAVLRLYALPARIEQHLLSLFGGYTRLGIDFTWQPYPLDLDESLAEKELVERATQQSKLAASYPGEFVVMVDFDVVFHSDDRAKATAAYHDWESRDGGSQPMLISPDRPPPPKLVSRGRSLKQN